MTVSTLEPTAPERTDASARPAPPALLPAPTDAEWPRLIRALAGTDDDELPLVGRLPA
jgi:hypothetical protein